MVAVKEARIAHTIIDAPKPANMSVAVLPTVTGGSQYLDKKPKVNIIIVKDVAPIKSPLVRLGWVPRMITATPIAILGAAL